MTFILIIYFCIILSLTIEINSAKLTYKQWVDNRKYVIIIKYYN